MATGMDALKERLAEIDDLQNAGAVLGWDQATYMPPGGGPARGRQLATLGRLAHEKFTDPAIGKLLDGLRPYQDGLDYDSDDAALLRVTRRDYERAVKVPSPFVAELYRHQAESFDVWAKARPANDFAAVQPFLEKTLDMSRRYAEFFPGYEHVADPLIDDSDYGMKASSLRAIFAELRQNLVPIVQQITSQPPADDECLHRGFAEAQQLAFGKSVIKLLGFDFERGRQDMTHHPFTTGFSIGDVRITTRCRENDLSDALFSTVHEAGHALYEQGVSTAYERGPLAGGTSSGVHESQSRLWENLVGRSQGFWQHFYPVLQQTFPGRLDDVSTDAFYRAINKVQQSLIRTDADEVTYNLHVIIRFDLELAMLEGKLAIRDLPEAWQERYRSDLGVAAPDNRDGVLQDVHWYAGMIGGQFQGYTLGNILGAQFFGAAVNAHPGIPAEIVAGQFTTLHQWLIQNIYRHGRKFTADELVRRATGSPLTIQPYVAYLRSKYGQLYRLS